MRSYVLTLAGLLTLGWPISAQAQKNDQPGPAALLPAKVVGYAELTRPGSMLKEVRELFKGSYLYNVPDSLAPLQVKLPPMTASQALVTLNGIGLVLSPEISNELSHMHAVAVGLLGVKTKDAGKPDPDFVVIIQPGKSNAPGFFMRVLMSTAQVKVEETVEGVKIYQAFAVSQTAFKGKPGDPPPPPPKVQYHPDGPAFAMMPGTIFVGTRKAIKDCVLRAKGKAAGDSLASNKDFQEAHKKVAAEPGIFLYGDTSALTDMLTDIGKASPPPAADIFDIYTKLVNPKAMPSWTASLSLKAGTLHVQRLAKLDAREKSPLLEFFPAKAVGTNVLHFAPKDSILALALSNADGEQRWDKLVQNLDDIVPAQLTGGNKIGDALKAVEQQLGVKIGPDVMAKVKNIGFAIGNPISAPFVVRKTQGPDFTEEAGGPEVPMVLILEATDAAALKSLKKLMREIVKLAENKDFEPTSKMIKGHKVHSLQMRSNHALSYGEVGNTLVIGPYAEGVGQALADGSAKKGLAADAKVVAQLKAFKSPVMVEVIRPSLFLYGLGGISGYRTASKKGAVGPDGNVPPAQPKDTKTTVTIKKDSPADAKLKKELLDILDLEPTLVIGATRGEDFIRIEGKASGWDKFVPKMTNFALERLLERPGPNHAFGHGEAKPIPGEDRPDDAPARPQADGKRQGAPAKGPGAGKVVFTTSGELSKESKARDGFFQQVHKVELTESRKYAISVVADKKKFFDTYLIVQDARGKALAQNDDGGEGLNSRLIFQPKETATYQLVVTSFKEGETGRYTLTVTEQ